MKWSKEDTLEFLRFYKEHPAIWDYKNPDHQNRQVIADAWMNIKHSLSFECTIRELKNKKDSLVSTFRNILRRIKARGVADSDVCGHHSDWFAYKIMATFLLETANHIKPRNKTWVKPVYEPNVYQNENESINSDNTNVETTGLDWSRYIGVECEISSQSPKRSHEPDELSKKRKRTSFIETTPNCDDGTQSIVIKANEQNVQEKDVCSLYTDLLATKLRSLNENTRDMLMRDIDNLYICAKYKAKISPLININNPGINE